jgi:hypothetical protein
MPDQNAIGRAEATQAVQQVAFGVGNTLQAIPAGSTNGTLVPLPGTNLATGYDTITQGLRFYLPANTSFSFAVASTQPVSAPTSFTVGPYTTPTSWDEALADQVLLFITGTNSGTVLYRWI